MAHKTLDDGRKVIDWETGDPEGDRKYVMQAYQDFVKELCAIEQRNGGELTALLDRWSINTTAQVDDFPRIWIKRPE